ncbi:MAG: hypothetical protein ACUVRG_06405 [Ignavibacterium sp.]|uniref:hypothetical protein n=1 Tax=Ignavibacterium sp. TaxID=2651167 RepID=UPI00404B0AF2
MKKLISYLTILILFAIIGCKEESVITPPSESYDFFPLKSGSRYLYNFYYDANSELIGSKAITIENTTNINGTEYFIEIDSAVFDRALTIDTTYFRKSRTGVFYFIDTTGVSAFIPDSIRNQLSIDTESRLLFLPLALNQTWPVYEVNFALGGIPVYSIIKISAKVVDSYMFTQTFKDSSVTRLVNKIRYDMDVQLSPTSPKETFTAYGYTMDGIGFIKWEGETLVLSLIRGGMLDFSGTISSSFVTEELLDYSNP